jgi:hypothetical protein
VKHSKEALRRWPSAGSAPLTRPAAFTRLAYHRYWPVATFSAALVFSAFRASVVSSFT